MSTTVYLLHSLCTNTIRTFSVKAVICNVYIMVKIILKIFKRTIHLQMRVFFACLPPPSSLPTPLSSPLLPSLPSSFSSFSKILLHYLEIHFPRLAFNVTRNTHHFQQPRLKAVILGKSPYSLGYFYLHFLDHNMWII